jgi:hypothetical protein
MHKLDYLSGLDGYCYLGWVVKDHFFMRDEPIRQTILRLLYKHPNIQDVENGI